MPRLQQIYQGIRFSHCVNDLMQQVRHRYAASNISSRLSSQRKADSHIVQQPELVYI